MNLGQLFEFATIYKFKKLFAEIRYSLLNLSWLWLWKLYYFCIRWSSPALFVLIPKWSRLSQNKNKTLPSEIIWSHYVFYIRIKREASFLCALRHACTGRRIVDYSYRFPLWYSCTIMSNPLWTSLCTVKQVANLSQIQKYDNPRTPCSKM